MTINDQEKFTQMPEVITEGEQEMLWYQDKTNREKRQVFSLDFLRRFIMKELSDNNYVEQMLDKMEE